jgi:hypothetical protein
MEFHIGLADPRPRPRQLRPPVKTLLYPPGIKFSLKRWFILPDRLPVILDYTTGTHCNLYNELSVHATGLKRAYKYAEEMNDFDTPFNTSDFVLPITLYNPFVVPVTLVVQFKEGIKKNAWCRQQFLKLYTRWRIRKFKKVNEVDPVTLEIPTHPVSIYDWATYTKYVYDAKTVMRDISEKLLLRDEMFPMATVPRNPLTNKNFTKGQLWGLVEQLRVYGKTNWAIEGYAKCSFSIQHFNDVYSIPLNKSALQRFFSDIRSFELNETLLDFIESQHQMHNVEYNRNLYRWAALKSPMNPRLCAWRDMCYRYYLNSILYIGDPNVLSQRQATDVYYPSLRLCSTAKEIYQERMMAQ